MRISLIQSAKNRKRVSFLGRNYCWAISFWGWKNLKQLMATFYPEVSTTNSSGSMTSQLLIEQEDCPVWGLKTVLLNNRLLSNQKVILGMM